MPFDRDVTIDFNADISGYSQSMSQMIQQTSQYSAAADGMIGKIGALNSVVLSGVKVLTQWTGTNKTATAQAAAYQQQLSKIETSAKVTGKSFRELEKTTKSLAKDFPIGMKQAVEQVESLQEAGVTTNKEINSLAKTFTKLGAATGTFGPELGKNMLQLNRTFEHGTDSMEKYADSLTTVTHLYGANAGAVTSFAKSIAPVAATVGMSETSVIGLSTAFSRLGEDGYAAANTFNKVMLDMSKSIREGTPEAKIYAEVMGTTATDLKKQWESNPAEGFIDFVEAIKAQGTDGIRSLEQLGLEGVRTQKTIMALANSGDMRKIVETAQQSYGNGMTGTAAETAMGGVNDQLTMLNETMAQTTATAGKPFLSFLEKVLQVANSISKVISDLVESDVIQGFAKTIGVVGGAAGLAKFVTSVATGGALAEKLLIGPARGVIAGRREGLTGADDSLSRRVGAISNLYLPGGGGGGGGGIRGLASGARGLVNMGGNLGALWFRSNANMIEQEMGREGLTTAQGRSIRESSAAMSAIAGNKDLSWTKRRELLAMEMAHATSKLKDLSTMPGGLGKMAEGYAKELKAAGSYWRRAGGLGVQGLSAIGGMAGLTGTTAAVGGAVGIAAGAGYLYYKGEKQSEEARERGGKDAYRMFNEFAEKAGIATKGLVSFAQAVNESTSAIAAQSKTREEAYEFTAEERLQTLNPSYEAAYKPRGFSFWDRFTNPGGPDVEKEALRVRGILGENASPEAINRMQMDISAEGGETFAKSVMDQVKEWEIQKLTPEQLEGKYANAAEKSRVAGIWGGSEKAEFEEMREAERVRRQKRDIDIMGAGRVQAEDFATGERAWAAFQAKESAPGAMSRTERMDAIDAMAKSMTLSAEDQGKIADALEHPENWTKSFPDLLKASGLDTLATSYEQGLVSGPAAGAGQYQNLTPAQLAGMGKSQAETLAGESYTRFKDAGAEAGILGIELANTNKIIRESGKTFDEWQEAGQEGASEIQKAYADVQAQPGSSSAQFRLANLAAEKAIKQAQSAGGGTATAAQIIAAAQTTSTGPEAAALQQAQQILQQRSGEIESGRGRWQIQAETISTGKTAHEMLMGPEAESLTAEQRALFEAQDQAGTAARQQQEQEVRAFMLQQRRQEEDFNRSRYRMNRDFEQSMAYQAEDFAKQRRYMIEDYHTGVLRAEQDFYTQRQRAQRDFDKQVKRQAEATAKSMFDPYQRIAPQIVTDIAVLQQSLLEQNQSVSQQLSSVDKLAKMGLSKDAIDQLKLMDPTQGQQVQRLLSDARTDPKAIERVNQLIETRIKLSGKLSTSKYNKDFQNMKEDFETGMDDMADDFEKNMKRGSEDFAKSLKRNNEAFATAQSRAVAQHDKALRDMDADNKRAKTRATEDLTGMADEFTGKYTDIQKKFLTDLAKLPTDLSSAQKKAIKAVLENEIKAIEEANTTATAAAGRSAPSSAWAMGSGPSGGGGGPAYTGPGGDTDLASFFAQRIGDDKIIGLGAGHKTPTWHEVANACLQNVAWAKRYLGDDVRHTGYSTAWSVGDAIRREMRMHTNDYNAPAGALYWWDSTIGGGAGHVAVADGKGNAINNWGSDRIEIHPVRGMSPNAYRGWSTYSSLATGGIVSGPTRALVGEAGREAIIPLNDKGTRYLADALSEAARYWQPTAASGTRSQGYSAPVTNNIYTYDQRTQFMGEVSVASQDPEDMARKLANRERRNRLARKTGSAA